jgi:hypothetical protein
MCPSTDYACSANATPAKPDEHETHTLEMRVSAESREIPGLKLTVAQAARLFSI